MTICFDFRILTVQTGFCSLLNACFIDMQMTGGYIYQVKSLVNSLSWRRIQKKNRPEKCPFITTTN